MYTTMSTRTHIQPAFSHEQQLIKLRQAYDSFKGTFAEHRRLARSAATLVTVWREFRARGRVPHWYEYDLDNAHRELSDTLRARTV